MVTSAPSPLRFEVEPGVVARHDHALVVTEQRPAGGHVAIRNLATGESSCAPVASLQGREIERLSDLLDVHEDRLCDVSEADLARGTRPRGRDSGTARNRWKMLSQQSAARLYWLLHCMQQWPKGYLASRTDVGEIVSAIFQRR